MLEVKNLKKRFGDFEAVKGMSFSVSKTFPTSSATWASFSERDRSFRPTTVVPMPTWALL